MRHSPQVVALCISFSLRSESRWASVLADGLDDSSRESRCALGPSHVTQPQSVDSSETRVLQCSQNGISRLDYGHQCSMERL